MVFTIERYPQFSWSNSRDRLAAECARKYFWRYYRSWNGWLADADEVARRAYALSKLTTYPMALGDALHKCAAQTVIAIKRGRARPTLGQLRNQVRGALNAVYLSSKDRDAFLARPKSNPMLVDAYYGYQTSRQHLDQTRERMEQCLEHLMACALWDELAACTPEDILVVDTRFSFVHKGLTVYAAPDLLYRRAGRWIVVDWKTGAPDEDGEDEQIAVYGLCLRDGLGKPFLDGECEGRIVNLVTGEVRSVPVTQEMVAAAEARVAESAAGMAALVVGGDTRTNAPLSVEAFVTAQNTRGCRWCQFHELCGAAMDAGAGEIRRN